MRGNHTGNKLVAYVALWHTRKNTKSCTVWIVTIQNFGTTWLRRKTESQLSCVVGSRWRECRIIVHPEETKKQDSGWIVNAS